MDWDYIKVNRLWEQPRPASDSSEYLCDPAVPKSHYKSIDSAIQDEDQRVYLNGEWKHKYFSQPDLVKTRCLVKDFDDADWDLIQVPSNIQLHGLSSPVYTNIRYPFPIDIPKVPEENPSVVYRCRFNRADNYDGSSTIIFEGVNASFYLFCNGVYVGEGHDSRSAFTFDLTALLESGENSIAVVVLRWAWNSYLEDQDMWWLSGIYRNVYLLNKAAINIRDIDLKTDWASDRGGSLDLYIDLYMEPDRSFWIMTHLVDFAGEQVFDPERYEIIGGADQQIFLRWRNLDVIPWDPDRPQLYRLIVELSDENNNVIDCEANDVGFRSIDVKDGLVRLNGTPIVFRGVNRHEHHPEKGHSISREDMLADIILLKGNNFNAVRCSHYPNQDLWYQLCNRYGLMVIDEVNIETHGLEPVELLSDDLNWRDIYLERTYSCYERHKNHACIVAWSLGNESGLGQNQFYQYQWLKAQDDRPVVYEGGGADHKATDVIFPMYARVEEDVIHESEPPKYALKKWLEKDAGRALLLCEYAHAMGNSGGGLSGYWSTFTKEQKLQGGFVWDWMDQGLLLKEGSLNTYSKAWAYGGDFGEEVHDANFCLNGILFPDRTEKPSLHELKYLQQAWKIELNKDITQLRFVYTGFSMPATRFRVFFYRNGIEDKLLLEGALSKADSWWEIPSEQQINDGSERAFFIECFLSESCSWADSGHIVAQEWIKLHEGIKVKEEALIDISSSETELELNNLEDWEHGLLENLDLAIWRAPTDNDLAFSEYPNYHPKSWYMYWKKQGLYDAQSNWHKIGPSTFEKKIICETGQVAAQLRISKGPSDESLLSLRLKHNLKSLARIGLKMNLKRRPEEVSWYGRGPHENYPDRKSSAFPRIYHLSAVSSTLSKLVTPYIRPQENGLRSDCRYLKIDNWKIEADRLFHFSCLPFSPEQLSQESHFHRLQEQAYTLHLDLAHMGLGGDDSWSPSVAKEFLLGPGLYEAQFRIIQVATNQ